MKRLNVSDTASPQRGVFKRLGGLVVVVGLHAVLLAVLVNGLAHRAVVAPPQLIMASIIPPDKPPEPESPPLLKPALAEPPRLAVPAPRVKPVAKRVVAPRPPMPQAISALPSPPPSPVTVAETPPQAAVSAPTTTHAESRAEPEHLPAKVDPSHSCRPPDYPPLSRRLGETGVVAIKFLIDEGGSVVDSMVERSSDHPRLDDAAREALSLCRFKPGTVDGKPERAWARIQYVWKLD